MTIFLSGLQLVCFLLLIGPDEKKKKKLSYFAFALCLQSPAGLLEVIHFLMLSCYQFCSLIYCLFLICLISLVVFTSCYLHFDRWADIFHSALHCADNLTPLFLLCHRQPVLRQLGFPRRWHVAGHRLCLPHLHQHRGSAGTLHPGRQGPEADGVPGERPSCEVSTPVHMSTEVLVAQRLLISLLVNQVFCSSQVWHVFSQLMGC